MLADRALVSHALTPRSPPPSAPRAPPDNAVRSGPPQPIKGSAYSAGPFRVCGGQIQLIGNRTAPWTVVHSATFDCMMRRANLAPATNEVGHLANGLGAFLFARCPEGAITYREQALRHARTWWRMHRNAAFSVVVCALPCSLDMFAGGLLKTFSGERAP